MQDFNLGSSTHYRLVQMLTDPVKGFLSTHAAYIKIGFKTQLFIAHPLSQRGRHRTFLSQFFLVSIATEFFESTQLHGGNQLSKSHHEIGRASCRETG